MALKKRLGGGGRAKKKELGISPTVRLFTVCAWRFGACAMHITPIMGYSKHWIPLECNPDLFTQLIHQLGVSSDIVFQDVLSLDPDMLSLIPRPVLALILVFPTSKIYEDEKAVEESMIQDYKGSGEQECIWFKQTINNACGFYGILHAICNGDARNMIAPSSTMAKVLTSCIPLEPSDRAKVIESSEEIESAYRTVALQGDSDVPEDAEAEVDFHYVCFVKSSKSGHLYELDGDRKGPVDHGALESDADVLSDRGLGIIQKFIRREEGANVNFSLLALVPS